ncbi:MAG: hypothetical protein A2937_03975 [Candidatus Yonathbacteria bacterium RIFCSPLOWO2_01_FULL_47_33b]|uniref:Radical SAM core domain-containing protein n=1 Tax=Candidatus Yonathbacteria bacterium RIFCSPLOWO2_01_FULL_47_33b TaxID=1802727 RepID=A0A1G2SFQ2_9BACT|nr:MAG: hypothetical protein A2937_03975 [Candidatus Yonathbacteria bacterium RIFCSPLOWO2_01_FULL_47_33b]
MITVIKWLQKMHLLFNLNSEKEVIMYPKLLDGAILRGRHNCEYPSDADRVAVTLYGETYLLTPELFRALSLCDGLTPICEIPGLDSLIKEIPACFEVIELNEKPNGGRQNQLVETYDLVAPCRHAIWHLTRKCNMKCSHCYYLFDDGEPKKQMFSNEEILTTARNLSLLGVESVRLSGGEASINQSQFEMTVDVLTRKYCIPIVLNTNGWRRQDFVVKALQNNPFVRGVQVSLDGTMVSHNTLRGVQSHKEIVLNIARYLDAGIHVRVISMLTDDWMNKESLKEVCKLASDLGVKDWVIEVPSVTGKCIDDGTKRVQDIADLAYKLLLFLEKGNHSIKKFSLTQVFDWPMLLDREHKTLQDPACSHDLGLITFGPEGVSYCTLFQKQFGENMSHLGHLHTDQFVEIWNTIARVRLSRTISDNTSCKECNLFQVCQGGCPGQYTDAVRFQGCDNHSKNLALAKLQFFERIGKPIQLWRVK